MERKKYVKNLEDFIIELKSNTKTELIDTNKKWKNDIDEFEAIAKKYKAHEIKKNY